MEEIILRKEDILGLLEAQKKGYEKAKISLDIGLTKTDISIKEGYALFPKNEKLCLADIAQKKIKDEFFYMMQDSTLKKLYFFSDDTNLFYKLQPTKNWPTVTISSVPMHKVTFSGPKEDTLGKIKALETFGAIKKDTRCLDTCMGLGYTAIELAKKAKEVVSFERDENIRRMVELNPYSKELFTRKNIRIVMGDVFEKIKKIGNEEFDIVLHDPPTPTLSPLLYSQEFYKQVLRVMKKWAVIYHYTPMPGNKKKKRDFPEEVRKKMVDAGFRDIKFISYAQGIVARK